MCPEQIGGSALSAEVEQTGAGKSRQQSRRLLFARTWTVDLKGRNVRIHVLGPGAIDTTIQEGIPRRSWSPSSP